MVVNRLQGSSANAINFVISKESKENLTCLGHSAAQSDDCEPSIETYVPEVKKRKVHLLSPEYVVYKDHDLDTAAKAGKIAPDLRQRLVRATISNMMATAYAAPYNRLPTNQEINEMAKSLIITYPCLRDNDTGHVSIQLFIQRAADCRIAADCFIDRMQQNA